MNNRTDDRIDPMATKRVAADDPRFAANDPRWDDKSSGPGKWIAAAVLLIALAVGAFFALGGDVDVDSEGGDVDVELPDTAVDVDAPDVDADVDVSVDEGDAEAGLDDE